jgi:hypothetical protein
LGAAFDLPSGKNPANGKMPARLPFSDGVKPLQAAISTRFRTVAPIDPAGCWSAHRSRASGLRSPGRFGRLFEPLFCRRAIRFLRGSRRIRRRCTNSRERRKHRFLRSGLHLLGQICAQFTTPKFFRLGKPSEAQKCGNCQWILLAGIS